MSLKEPLILAIDQGTSSTKTIVFNKMGEILAKGSEPLPSYFPAPGYVEQKPEEIYDNMLNSIELCLKEFSYKDGNPEDISSCGISNQRETLVVWDKSGQPLHNAVVWQCKRSINICDRLSKENLEDEIQRITGLRIDPYFSGTKMIWLYENVPAIKKAVDEKQAYFGTIDSWLLFKLTGGKSYYTDYTNASRTLFFNITNLEWDQSLLMRFGLGNLNLPTPVSSSYQFGETDFDGLLSKPIPVTGMIGDSHAAAFGEGCYRKGSAKATLGTGSSILLNTGSKPIFSKGGMVTTICWSTSDHVDYALEGVIVTCGATIEWLKNQLGLIEDSHETESMANRVPDNNGVYLIPAFSGMGAPHWKMNARALVTGLTFACTKDHIVRAALESIPYQIKDVIAEMEIESSISLEELKVDGGISSNRFVIQFLTDLLNVPVTNIGIADVSALGAALIAGLGNGIYRDIKDIHIKLSGSHIFNPGESRDKIMKDYEGWKSALKLI